MKKLFCPGPVNVAVDIAELAMSTNIGHRSAEFEQIFENIKQMTLRIFHADGDSYVCLPITGSATLANEMCISSVLDGGDRVLLLTNGVFGDRLKKMLEIYHIPYDEYREEKNFNMEKIDALMQEKIYTWVLMVHHETSTGMLNPIGAVSETAHRHGAKIMVDAVSSAGADPIDISGSRIDIFVTTSGKAIGSYPGIGLICIAKDIYCEGLKKVPRSDYLNVFSNLEFSEESGQSLHTPSTPLFVALEAQMHKLLISPSYNYDRYRKMNSYIRREMKKLGVSPYLEDEMDRSVTLSSFLLDPAVFDVGKFVDDMNDRGYVLYIGKGKLKDIGLFQIANMGDLRMTDCYDLIESIKKELESGDCKWT